MYYQDTCMLLLLLWFSRIPFAIWAADWENPALQTFVSPPFGSHHDDIPENVTLEVAAGSWFSCLHWKLGRWDIRETAGASEGHPFWEWRLSRGFLHGWTTFVSMQTAEWDAGISGKSRWKKERQRKKLGLWNMSRLEWGGRLESPDLDSTVPWQGEFCTRLVLRRLWRGQSDRNGRVEVHRWIWTKPNFDCMLVVTWVSSAEPSFLSVLNAVP